MNFDDDVFGRDAPKKQFKTPFMVYEPDGRLMKITGEYDLGDGVYFLVAEEMPVYSRESRE